MMDVVVVFCDGGEEASGVAVEDSKDEGVLELLVVALGLAVPPA